MLSWYGRYSIFYRIIIQKIHLDTLNNDFKSYGLISACLLGFLNHSKRQRLKGLSYELRVSLLHPWKSVNRFYKKII